MTTGAGIGTVDPDWPHFKAMDEILSRKNSRQHNLYKENILEGPRCEDIKQEIIDDIDINDDMESFTTSSVNGSECDAEFEDDGHPMPPLMPAPREQSEQVKIAPKPLATLQHPKPLPKIIPSAQISTTTTQQRPNGAPTTLPFPLLILNGLPTAQNATAQQVAAQKKSIGSTLLGNLGPQDLTTNLLRNLLDVQKENLEIERQRLEIEKQKLDFQKRIGTQLTALLPMFGAVLQRLSTTNDHKDEENISEQEEAKPAIRKYSRKRPCPENGLDILKDSKILRNVLEEGIKKYMMSEIKDEKIESSDKEDSGIQNTDDDSNPSSDKK